MNIAFIDIQNFRKLEKCRIELSKDKTIFVGANNSGKTSAMDALSKFLIGNNKFIFNDIFVVRRQLINEIGIKWCEENATIPENLSEWGTITPLLDVWINVSDDEIQFVSHIIPTLKWKGGIIGIRFSYQPSNIEKLFLDFRKSFLDARETESNASQNKLDKKLWPKNLCDFLERNLNDYFSLIAYKLDPSKCDEEQNTISLVRCVNNNPIDGLIKVDMIPAQRGFSDVETKSLSENKIAGSLSSQLRSYYDKHLDPEKSPSTEDLDTLIKMEAATNAFDSTLKEKFKNSIQELEQLGYPGVSDPRITISTKVSALETLKHESAVQYALAKDTNRELNLPEKYNGLGYQNLISIVFQLIRFRDDWVKEGKAKKEENLQERTVEPIHLVLLEEPEAHLHVQVQQVLIRKAYDVLQNNCFLKNNKGLSTQLIVSTHSSHIAKECKFENLRYFKRIEPTIETVVGTSTVINLSTVFGNGDATAKFVTRYLQTTHCDLFFADAAILIEGTAEEMLLPHFIKNNYPELHQRYLSIMMLKGRHTHRFAQLLDKLAIPILVIADLDVGEPSGHHKKAKAQRGMGLISTNYAINNWLMNEKSLDILLDKKSEEKVIVKNTNIEYLIKAAYQTEIEIDFKNMKVKAIPTTFEDSLIYTNFALFTKLIEKRKNLKCEEVVELKFLDNLIKNITDSNNYSELQEKISVLIESSGFKASFALDLIYEFEPDELTVPDYIEDGLCWLQKQLKHPN